MWKMSEGNRKSVSEKENRKQVPKKATLSEKGTDTGGRNVSQQGPKEGGQIKNQMVFGRKIKKAGEENRKEGRGKDGGRTALTKQK